jgi:hypothetical protein
MNYLQQDLLISSTQVIHNAVGTEELKDNEFLWVDLTDEAAANKAKVEEVRKKLQSVEKQRIKQALPNTTVFFRFSHRDENKEVLSIEKQKEKVKEVLSRIMHNQAKYQE